MTRPIARIRTPGIHDGSAPRLGVCRTHCVQGIRTPIPHDRIDAMARFMSDHPSPQSAQWPESTIFTVGHSTLAIERFVAVLHAYGIERLADIRTVPRSRHNPQFNAEQLAGALKAEDIDYVRLPALGGLRYARKD